MKKVILSLCFMIAAVSFVSAQQAQGGGQGRQGMQERMNQMKDSLGLTDAQLQTVMSVQQEFRQQRMDLRNASEADRPAKMKEVNDAMQKRLGEALKDPALAQRIAEYNARHSYGRGGGRRGGQQGGAPQQ